MPEITNYLEHGIRKGLLKIEGVYVTYLKSDGYKARWGDNNPEEKVRAEFYVELVEKYKYDPKRIQFEVTVPKRTPHDRADIVVFKDDECKAPYIVVECKKADISEAEFEQAVEQAFGNAHGLNAPFAVVVAGVRYRRFDVAGFKAMEREKNRISDIPVKYGNVPKYQYVKADLIDDITPVTEGELKTILNKCHDIVWQGGRLAPTTAFDEISKLLFCKMLDEKMETPNGKPYGFQVGTKETAKEVADRVKAIYEKARTVDSEVFREDIRLDDPIIYNVVEQLQKISLSKTNLDVKGAAFEYFMTDFFKGKMGQYFTPREVIQFAIQILPPDKYDYVIDPACGSGGFLLHAMDYIRCEAEEGFDDSEAYKIWHDFAMKNLYGSEINDQIARICKMNMIIHDDGHTNIISTDSLQKIDNITFMHATFKPERFDMLYTNPPFGASVKATEKTYLTDYELGKNNGKERKTQKTEILFIERCWHFLKPGGKMAIVLPDGVLTNSSLQYVRDFIMEKFQIMAVVSLPQFAFASFGAGVKASLLFLRKWNEGEDTAKDYDIFMAQPEHIGYDATGRKDKSDFPKVLEAWEQFKGGARNFPEAPFAFAVKRGEIEGLLDVGFYGSIFSIRKSFDEKSYDIVRLGDIAKVNPARKKPEVDEDELVPYIGLPNTDEENLIVNEVVERPYREVKGRRIAKKGDILFARIEPSVYNKKYIYLEDLKGYEYAFVSTEFLTIKAKMANVKFIFWFLHSEAGYKQVFGKVTGSTGRRRIDPDKLESFLIPDIPLPVQNEIVTIMDNALAEKNAKEARAEELLDSIDGYVLDKLGIQMPEMKDELVYTVNANSMKAGRQDVSYWQPKYIKSQESIVSGLYEAKRMGDLVKVSTGAMIHTRNYQQDGIPLIRIQNIHEDGVIFEGLKYISEVEFKRNISCKLLPNDIVFGMSGTIGRATLIPENIRDCCLNQRIAILRDFKDVIPNYLLSVINSSIVFCQLLRVGTGGLQINVSSPDLRGLEIPVPQATIQKEISSEVSSRRAEAKRLREEAAELYESAKKKVEEMILEGE